MTDTDATPPAEPVEVVDPGPAAAAADGQAAEAPAPPEPDVTDPAKLIRLGTMLQTVLAELHASDDETDSAGVNRLAQIHAETIEELQGILSEDLHDELMEFNQCCDHDDPTADEMRVAHAQLVGWIQGLLRGMQATATAQAQMAQQQMAMMQAAQQQALMQRGQQQQARPGAPAAPDSGYL